MMIPCKEKLIIFGYVKIIIAQTLDKAKSQEIAYS